MPSDLLAGQPTEKWNLAEYRPGAKRQMYSSSPGGVTKLVRSSVFVDSLFAPAR